MNRKLRKFVEYNSVTLEKSDRTFLILTNAVSWTRIIFPIPPGKKPNPIAILSYAANARPCISKLSSSFRYGRYRMFIKIKPFPFLRKWSAECISISSIKTKNFCVPPVFLWIPFCLTKHRSINGIPWWKIFSTATILFLRNYNIIFVF